MEAPLSKPPEGDVNGRSIALVALISVCVFLSTATFVMRIGIRSLNNQLGWDDLTISITWILLIIATSFSGPMVHSGLGRHVFYLDKAQVRSVLKWDWLEQIVLYIAICLTKISIALFILRIKKTGWLKWVLYALIAGLIGTTLPCLVIVLAHCQPIHALWDRDAGTCWNKDIYAGAIWAQVAYSILSDFLFSLLPVVVLWNIRVPLRLKVAVFALMSVGFLTTGCATVRASLSLNPLKPDITWSRALITIWSILEIHLGMIAANIPLTRAVYIFFQKRRSRIPLDRMDKDIELSNNNVPGDRFRVIGGGRHPLSPGTLKSTAPFEKALIRKTTEFTLTEDANYSLDETGGLESGLHSNVFRTSA